MTRTVNSWKQRGHLYLWRYREGQAAFPGWHLAADATGAHGLLDLVMAFQQSPSPVHRTLQVTRPSRGVLAVPNNRGGRAAYYAPARLRICFDPGDPAANAWYFARIQDMAVLTIGREYLSSLEVGVRDILRGKGDYCIGGRDSEPFGERTCLWFWW